LSFSDIVNSYKSRLSIDGLTIRDEYINSIKDGFTDSFDNNVNYKEVLYKKRNETNYTTGIKVHVFQVKKDTEKIALDDFKKVVFKDLDFVCESGDLIKFDGYEWLLTSTNNIDHIKSCVVQQCGGNFVFVNNHVSYTVPYVLSTAGQGMGLDSDVMKYISEISNFVFMRIPDNNSTRLIEINDIVRLGRRSYKIVADSDIINPGLIIFKLEVVVESAITHVFTVDILNGSSLQIGRTQPLTINAELKDNDVVVSSPQLTYSSSNTSVATINSSGVVTILTVGSVVFTVALTSDSSVKDTINVEIIESTQTNYTYEIISNISPSSEVKYNQTKVFTASRYKNGVLETGVNFTFEVIPGTTPTNKYELLTLSGNTASLKTLGYSYFVDLKATDQEFPTKSVLINIKLRSVL